MSDILIFAGTTEGRLLAQFLDRQQVQTCVCAATEYGGQLLKGSEKLKVSSQRLCMQEMAELIKDEGISVVVDATHPYAVEVSENIKKACQETDCDYLRLLRASEKSGEDADTVYVNSVEEAVEFLKKTDGNILATTGSKELYKYTAIPDYQERVFARVLSTPEVAKSCAELGFTGKNLICMQGPFSEELNTAMLRQFDARWLVTKEAGKNGGYMDKIKAAQNAKARVVLIGRPLKEEGLSLEEVKKELVCRFDIPVKRKISMIGIGMGTPENMTVEAREACRDAQLLVGAGRMVKSLGQSFGKPCFVSYKPDEIYEYVYNHPEYEKIALLQSGDIGFYSGAKKLFQVFDGEEISVYPGISSPVYLCDKIHTSWEDVCLVSLHGRGSNIITKIRKNKKVFALVGKGSALTELLEKADDYGLGDVEAVIGENLSYPEERILRGSVKHLKEETFKDLCVVLFLNSAPDQAVTHGIADEAFLRGKVPMTKSEIRSISLSKLRLTPDAIVYDVGAGTGSISIEAAAMAEDGVVYAIEKNPDAVTLLKENKRCFGADNLEIIEGLAPEALRELPIPTHVFIGGSSGNMKEICETVLEKNPHVRIVINCIALESVAEAMNCIRELSVTDVDIAAVSVAKSKELGKYHMMMGLNPVYVISCTGEEK